MVKHLYFVFLALVGLSLPVSGLFEPQYQSTYVLSGTASYTIWPFLFPQRNDSQFFLQYSTTTNLVSFNGTAWTVVSSGSAARPFSPANLITDLKYIHLDNAYIQSRGYLVIGSNAGYSVESVTADGVRTTVDQGGYLGAMRSIDVASIRDDYVVLALLNTGNKLMLVRHFINPISQAREFGNMFQEITVPGGTNGIEFVRGGADWFLVAGCCTSGKGNVIVYRFDSVTEQFLPYQTFPATQSLPVRTFRWQSEAFFVIGNLDIVGFGPDAVPPKVYRYDPNTKLFYEYWTFDATDSLTAVHWFEGDGKLNLLMSHAKNDHDYYDSVLFQLIGPNFVPVQTFAHRDARHWVAFRQSITGPEGPKLLHLAVLNNPGTSTDPYNVFVYRWVGTESATEPLYVYPPAAKSTEWVYHSFINTGDYPPRYIQAYKYRNVTMPRLFYGSTSYPWDYAWTGTEFVSDSALRSLYSYSNQPYRSSKVLYVTGLPEYGGDVDLLILAGDSRGAVIARDDSLGGNRLLVNAGPMSGDVDAIVWKDGVYIASFWSGMTYIYRLTRWPGGGYYLLTHLTIDKVTSPSAVKFFEWNNTLYVLVGCCSTGPGMSRLFQVNIDDRAIVPIQEFATDGVRRFQLMMVESDPFVVVVNSNFFLTGDNNQEVEVWRWHTDAIEGLRLWRYAHIENLEAPTDVEVVTFQGQPSLLVTSLDQASLSKKGHVKLFQWNGTLFDEIWSLETFSAYSATLIRLPVTEDLPDVAHIAIAMGESSTSPTNAYGVRIYRLEGTEGTRTVPIAVGSPLPGDPGWKIISELPTSGTAAINFAMAVNLDGADPVPILVARTTGSVAMTFDGLELSTGYAPGGFDMISNPVHGAAIIQSSGLKHGNGTLLLQCTTSAISFVLQTRGRAFEKRDTQFPASVSGAGCAFGVLGNETFLAHVVPGSDRIRTYRNTYIEADGYETFQEEVVDEETDMTGTSTLNFFETPNGMYLLAGCCRTGIGSSRLYKYDPLLDNFNSTFVFHANHSVAHVEILRLDGQVFVMMLHGRNSISDPIVLYKFTDLPFSNEVNFTQVATLPVSSAVHATQFQLEGLPHIAIASFTDSKGRPNNYSPLYRVRSVPPYFDAVISGQNTLGTHNARSWSFFTMNIPPRVNVPHLLLAHGSADDLNLWQIRVYQFDTPLPAQAQPVPGPPLPPTPPVAVINPSPSVLRIPDRNLAVQVWQPISRITMENGNPNHIIPSIASYKPAQANRTLIVSGNQWSRLYEQDPATGSYGLVASSTGVYQNGYFAGGRHTYYHDATAGGWIAYISPSAIGALVKVGDDGSRVPLPALFNAAGAANAADFFRDESNTYLVTTATSGTWSVFAYNQPTGTFNTTAPIQSGNLIASTDQSIFTVDGATYMVSGCCVGATTEAGDSIVYRWYPSTLRFEPWQKIKTWAVVKWETYTFNGVTFGAYVSKNPLRNPEVFVWDRERQEFYFYEQLDFYSPQWPIAFSDIEFLEFSGNFYILVVNQSPYTGNSPYVPSTLFRLNGTNFVRDTEIWMRGARDATTWFEEGVPFIAFATGDPCRPGWECFNNVVAPSTVIIHKFVGTNPSPITLSLRPRAIDEPKFEFVELLNYGTALPSFLMSYVPNYDQVGHVMAFVGSNVLVEKWNGVGMQRLYSAGFYSANAANDAKFLRANGGALNLIAVAHSGNTGVLLNIGANGAHVPPALVGQSKWGLAVDMIDYNGLTLTAGIDASLRQVTVSTLNVQWGNLTDIQILSNVNVKDMSSVRFFKVRSTLYTMVGCASECWSILYKNTNETGAPQFKPIQRIWTVGARRWEVVSVEGEVFLLALNGYSTNPTYAPRLYRMHPIAGILYEYQDFPGMYQPSGVQFEVFQSRPTLFFSYLGRPVEEGGVKVFQWNGTDFTNIMNFRAPNAYDVTVFRQNVRGYVAVPHLVIASRIDLYHSIGTWSYAVHIYQFKGEENTTLAPAPIMRQPPQFVGRWELYSTNVHSQTAHHVSPFRPYGSTSQYAWVSTNTGPVSYLWDGIFFNINTQGSNLYNPGTTNEQMTSVVTIDDGVNSNRTGVWISADAASGAVLHSATSALPVAVHQYPAANTWAHMGSSFLMFDGNLFLATVDFGSGIRIQSFAAPKSLNTIRAQFTVTDASAVELFAYNNAMWLAVGVGRTAASGVSRLYNVTDPTAATFTMNLVATFNNGMAVSDIQYQLINNRPLLFVANGYNVANQYDAPVTVYDINGDTIVNTTLLNTYASYPSIQGAARFNTYVFNRTTLQIIVAQAQNSRARRHIGSKTYNINTTTGELVLTNRVPTFLARSAQYFEMDTEEMPGVPHMALTEGTGGDSSHPARFRLWRWAEPLPFAEDPLGGVLPPISMVFPPAGSFAPKAAPVAPPASVGPAPSSGAPAESAPFSNAPQADAPGAPQTYPPADDAPGAPIEQPPASEPLADLPPSDAPLAPPTDSAPIDSAPTDGAPSTTAPFTQTPQAPPLGPAPVAAPKDPLPPVEGEPIDPSTLAPGGAPSVGGVGDQPPDSNSGHEPSAPSQLPVAPVPASSEDCDSCDSCGGFRIIRGNLAVMTHYSIECPTTVMGDLYMMRNESILALLLTKGGSIDVKGTAYLKGSYVISLDFETTDQIRVSSRQQKRAPLLKTVITHGNASGTFDNTRAQPFFVIKDDSGKSACQFSSDPIYNEGDLTMALSVGYCDGIAGPIAGAADSGLVIGAAIGIGFIAFLILLLIVILIIVFRRQDKKNQEKEAEKEKAAKAAAAKALAVDRARANAISQSNTRKAKAEEVSEVELSEKAGDGAMAATGGTGAGDDEATSTTYAEESGEDEEAEEEDYDEEEEEEDEEDEEGEEEDGDDGEDDEDEEEDDDEDEEDDDDEASLLQ